jgi:hypothetical protein
MYMNCAVVDVKPKGSRNKRWDGQPEKITARDVARANVAAQTALSGYPPLFVANLKTINSCVTKETTDVVFDNPGKDVAFADGTSRSVSASFAKSKCTGQGSKSAGSSSSSSSPSSSGQSGGPSPGNNGQWNGGGQPQQQQQQPQSTSQTSGSPKCDLSDGQWHPECNGNASGQQSMSGSKASGVSQAKPVQQSSQQQSKQDPTTVKQPSPKVEKQLDAYLSNLYGSHTSRKEREAAPVQQVKDTKAISEPAAKSIANNDSLKNTSPQLLANEPFPRKHHTTLAHELDDVAGKDGPFEPNYEGLHTLQQSRVECARATVKCLSPNRWIKSGECTWECSRKGRSTKRSTFVHEVQSAEPKKTKNTIISMIESRLKNLETLMSRLLAFVEKKGEGKIQPRHGTNVTTTITPITTATPNGTASPPTPFDRFLMYLARLQTTVIECIRHIASTSPLVTNGTMIVSIEDAPPAELIGKTKRQLIIPELRGILEALVASLTGGPNHSNGQDRSCKDFDWANVYDDIKHETDTNLYPSTQETNNEPTSHMANATSAQYWNRTASAVNATNPLQEAADESAFKDDILAAQQANTPPTDPESDEAALLPNFFLPGPVLTSCVNVDWPGPNNPGEGKLEKMPAVVNDLGPGSEEQVEKWFENLEKGRVDALTGGDEAEAGSTGDTS